ncbi:MAG: biotin synthase BioB [Muribaculaceae bacterium]|nr:biotin synthase BioB [Muribaculaceae bacterium]
MTLKTIKDNILNGGVITRREADFLASYPDLDALCDAADEIRNKFCGDDVDSCSIVNARSGRCGEDCKWCAQASRHHTGCATYNSLPDDELLEAARANVREGIKRFSLVTSGRRVVGRDLDVFCRQLNLLREQTPLYLCASMGLLGKEEMQRLKDAGVKRYHCNMETSREVFETLCSTHTHDDKIATIRAAREVGMDVCSGGIIGMGESLAQRIDFAFELADLDVDSVPINILNPIPGTPLENTPPLSEEDIIRTVAIFRFILPTKALRFAGGRLALSHDAQLRIMRGGMNGVLMGDMLTTVSNSVDDDKKLFAEANLNF